MNYVIAQQWQRESKSTKIKRALKIYSRQLFWRLVAVWGIIVLGGPILTFIGVWGPFNWLINTVYVPSNGWVYAICGACFLWPLAVRLKEVLVLQSQDSLTIKKEIPRRVISRVVLQLLGYHPYANLVKRMRG